MNTRISARLKQNERGVQSPLATKAQRDRLARRPIYDMVYSSEEEEMEEDSIDAAQVILIRPHDNSGTLIISPEVSSLNEATKKRTSSRVAMSSPLPDVTSHNISSPQYSRIGADFAPPSSTVDKLREFRELQKSGSRNSVSIGSSSRSRGNTSGKVRRDELESDDDDGGGGGGGSSFRDTSARQRHVITTRSQVVESMDKTETPKRGVAVIQRSLSRSKPINDDSLKSQDSESSSSSRVSNLFYFLCFVSFSAALLGVFQYSMMQEPLVKFNSTRQQNDFRQRLGLVKERFPAQHIHLWKVIASSINAIFRRNLTMPACILLIGDTNEGQLAANCLASSMAAVFQSVISEDDAEVKQNRHRQEVFMDSSSLEGMETDDAKRKLFQTLHHTLSNDHAYSLLNLHQLRGNVSMALHTFCDEGSLSASFPHSTLIMTILSKQKVPDTANGRPEMIADALLNDAWSLELGDDKVSSLISRVAVSAAIVRPEVNLPPELCG